MVEALEGRTLLSTTPTSNHVVDSNQELVYRQSETITATVSVGLTSAPPSEGTVAFFDGSAPLGTATVSDGKATFTTTTLGVGLHMISAFYSGGADFAASASTAIQTIIPGAGLNRPRAVAVNAAGDVFIADTSNNRVVMLTPEGAQTVVAAGLNEPSGVAADAEGDVFIADTFNNRVLEITPAGTQTSVGSDLLLPTGVAVDSAGDVFIAESVNRC